MTGDVFDDLDSLKLTSELAAAMPAAKRGRQQRSFVMVPSLWVEKLNAARSLATWRLAMLLLHRNWRSKGRPVVVSNQAARACGVPPRAKSRALAELEDLGLIHIERSSRTSPRATVLNA